MDSLKMLFTYKKNVLKSCGCQWKCFRALAKLTLVLGASRERTFAALSKLSVRHAPQVDATHALEAVNHGVCTLSLCMTSAADPATFSVTLSNFTFTMVRQQAKPGRQVYEPLEIASQRGDARVPLPAASCQKDALAVGEAGLHCLSCTAYPGADQDHYALVQNVTKSQQQLTPHIRVTPSHAMSF
eukprot:6214752-Pleurochrysis_carterae.AAC.3